MTQMIDQSDRMNCLFVSVSPSKEMRDHTKERENSSNSAGIEPTTTSGFHSSDAELFMSRT